jgi:hypothetical protein
VKNPTVFAFLSAAVREEVQRHTELTLPEGAVFYIGEELSSEAISAEHFLSSIQRNSAENILENTRWVRSAYHGYFWKERIYISTLTLENEIQYTPPRQIIEINDSTFTDSRRISLKNINVCHNRRVIFIENTP